MTIPCKGWQQNCSASRVGTTVFHLKRGSHVAVKISERTQRGFSERWTATRKMRIPNVTVGGAGMQQVFFFFSEDVLVLYGFIPFLAGNWYNNKKQLEAERDLFGTTGKGYIESIW